MGRESSALSVLVVDDEPDMRLLIRAVLERAGMRVVGEATDAQEAVEMFRALSVPPVPSLVLLDFFMPGPSGLVAAARILADAPGQPIVLFSASFDDKTVAAAAELGVARCVPKKDITRLPEIIEAVLASR
jgi:CheY-like chemotaxis protein